jgi:hypothetical protein
MPTILYLWNFETGDTQGWTLSSYTTLDNTSKLQGVYSLKFYYSGTILQGNSVLVAYIVNIDLSTASKPILLLLARHNAMSAGTQVVVKDSAGNILLDVSVKGNYIYNHIVAVDLASVAGRSGLRIELYFKAMTGSPGNVTSYFDNIYIIDGGDKEYQIALIAFNNSDKTSTYNIPTSDRSLPSGSARFAVSLATPPHPLNEATDIFVYTATCDQGSAYINSTETNYKQHASDIASPSTLPTYFLYLTIRAFPQTAGSTRYSYDETVVVSFWSTEYVLRAVYVFRVAITINPFAPAYASAMINVTYGSTWSGQRDFQLDVNFYVRSLGVRLYVKYLVGDNTGVQAGTVKLEVYSSDYSTKYGESIVDLTSGSELRGATISDLPTSETYVFRISWNITALQRIVLDVRPEFIVY